MTRVFLQDVTLRDGMHALRHMVTLESVARIVRAIDGAGVDAFEVAHGDGLAGGSLNYGPGSHTDWQWLEVAAANLTRARLTTLLFMQHVELAGLEVVRVFDQRPTAVLDPAALIERRWGCVLAGSSPAAF